MEKIDINQLSEEQIAYLSREWIRVKQQNLRAQQAGAPATLTIHEWFRLIDEYQGLCAYCQRCPFEGMEHIIPVQSGGGTTADNCVPTCLICNSRKGIRSGYKHPETGEILISDMPAKRHEATCIVEPRVSIEQAAVYLHTSAKTVRRLIKQKKLQAVKFGKQYRIKREDLDTVVDGEEQTEQHVEHS